MSYATVLKRHQVTPEQWETQIAAEYLQQTWWSHVMTPKKLTKDEIIAKLVMTVLHLRRSRRWYRMRKG